MAIADCILLPQAAGKSMVLVDNLQGYRATICNFAATPRILTFGALKPPLRRRFLDAFVHLHGVPVEQKGDLEPVLNALRGKYIFGFLKQPVPAPDFLGSDAFVDHYRFGLAGSYRWTKCAKMVHRLLCVLSLSLAAGFGSVEFFAIPSTFADLVILLPT
ncbi:hypothetical protein K469DRAFT_688588 [Zopfia rhizophila CBS 207.26]|uniref:Uncharacterized protein n=1 Tax=Zopfia rhizophila CBS 207.26 TaxID=1314779 RepID=A0A6A6E1X5_9PEZI|nr:hypothetical protein K469DRAFT_688588 [Zopfia rhizophila CBS 207.26]